MPAHLIRKPNASVEELLEFIKGRISRPVASRLRQPNPSSRPTRPAAAVSGCGPLGGGGLGRGQWAIVVTEIPYQVQKSRLIEKIAELLTARKLPLLDDVRDESAEDIRVVLVPRSRNVDANF
jgi:topoisomerase-4 subunit A